MKKQKIISDQKVEGVKSRTIAQNLVDVWKTKSYYAAQLMNELNTYKLEHQRNIQTIRTLEAQNLKLSASKSMLQNKCKNYQKAIQIKGSQFAHHFKKILSEPQSLTPQQKEQVQMVLQMITKLIEGEKKTEKKIQLEEEQLQFYRKDDKQGKGHRVRKAPPIIKKNIYGYYESPQLPNPITTLSTTKHPEIVKYTQTLPDDLSILLLRPILKIELYDGNIKPHTNRHRLDYYVRIRYNSENYVDSEIRKGFQPVWNQPFLLRDYNFPFFKIQLINLSKGIKDINIGQSKIGVAEVDNKIANIKSQKGQFQGRIRFGIHYPQGTFYQFVITSVKLTHPKQIKLLKQSITIKCSMNGTIQTYVEIPDFITYCDLSLIIFQGDEDGYLNIMLDRLQFKGKIHVKQLMKKEGDFQISIKLLTQEEWIVTLCGHIFLLIPTDEKPQPISTMQLNHRYFSVKVSGLLRYAQYGVFNVLSSVKFPIVFRYQDIEPSLLLYMKQETIKYTPLLNEKHQVINREHMKVASKVYEIYCISLQGEKVSLTHGTNLYQRMPKQIKLKCRNNEFYIQTQQLMQGYYKVIQRTYKNTGYIKFKVGYQCYPNKLTMEGLNSNIINNDKEIKKDQERKLNLDGYYVVVEVSYAFLPDYSNSSSYLCEITSKNITQSTTKYKGNQPKWNQKFIIQLSPQISYQVFQFGILDSKTSIAKQTLLNFDQYIRLGVYCGNINNGIIYFGIVGFASQLYSLQLNRISVNTNQDEDWIGQNDPYIKIWSMNREVFRSNVIDGGGKNPVWQNLNTNIVSESRQMLGYLYDSDIIGKDDYLGEFLLKIVQNSQKIETNMIKEGKICGKVTLEGKFNETKLQILKIPSLEEIHKSPPENNKMIFQVRIFCLNLFEKPKQEQGWFESKDRSSSQSFILNQQGMKTINYTLYLFEQSEITIKLMKRQKTFFKKQQYQVGLFKLLIQQNNGCFGLVESDIQKDGVKIGSVKIAIEPIDNVNIGVIASSTCGIQSFQLFSDIQDSHIILSDSNYETDKKGIIIFKNKLKAQGVKQKKQYQLQPRQRKTIFQQYLVISNNIIYCKFVMAVYPYKRKRYPTISVKTIASNALQLSLLQWQSTKPNKEYQLHIDSGSQIIIKLDKQQKKRLLVKQLPKSMKVIENNKVIYNEVRVFEQKYIAEKGILMYEWRQALSPYCYINLKWFYLKIKQTEQQSNISLSIQHYQNVKYNSFIKIGKNGYYFQNVTFFVNQINQQPEIYFNLCFNYGAKLIQIKMSKINGSSLPIYQSDEYCYHAYLEVTTNKINTKQPLFRKQDLSHPYEIQIQRIDMVTSMEVSNQVKIKIIIENQEYTSVMEGSQNKFWMYPAKPISMIISQHGLDNRIMHIEMWVEGILKNKYIGFSEIIISTQLLNKLGTIQLQGQIKNQIEIVGQMTVKFNNASFIDYFQIDIDRLIVKDNSNICNLVVTYDQFQKKHKNTIQSIKNKHQIREWRSLNNITIISDQRQKYLFEINLGDTNLGSFNLKLDNYSDEEKMVRQPLRLNTLNGLLIFYVNRYRFDRVLKCQQELKQQNKIKNLSNKQLYVKVTLYSFNFVDQYQEMQISIQNNSRKLTTRLYSTKEQKQIIFYLSNDSSVSLGFIIKKQVYGKYLLNFPYYHQEERMICFYNHRQGKPTSLCRCRIQYLKDSFMEIISIQAVKLANTQYFVDMTPYVEIKLSYNSFITELGHGKEFLFWMINLLVKKGETISIFIKDKDMFFDDYVGGCQVLIDQSRETLTQLQDQENINKTGKIKMIKRIIQGLNHQNIPLYYQKAKECFTMILYIKSMKKLEGCCKIVVTISNRSLIIINCDKIEIIKDLQMATNLIIQKDERLLSVIYFKHHQLRKQNILAQQKIIVGPQERDLLNQKLNGIMNYELKSVKMERFAIEEIWIWGSKIDPHKQYLFTIKNSKTMSQLEYNEGLTTGIYDILVKRQNIYIYTKDTLIAIQQGELKLIIIQGEKRENIWGEYSLMLPQLKANLIVQGSIRRSEQIVGKIYIKIKQLSFKGYQSPKNNYLRKPQLNLIQLEIVRASIKKDLQFFSKMDPYCIIQMGKQKKKTTVQQDIGQNPIWNEHFVMQITQSEILLTLIDSQVTKDRQIGTSLLNFSSFSQKNNKKQFTLPILANKEDNGQIVCNIWILDSYIVFTWIIADDQRSKDIILENNLRKDKIIEGQIIGINRNQNIIIKIQGKEHSYKFEELRKNNNNYLYIEGVKMTYMIFGQ